MREGNNAGDDYIEGTAAQPFTGAPARKQR